MSTLTEAADHAGELLALVTVLQNDKARAEAEVVRLRGVLEEVRAEAHDNMDVVDGDYGEPSPDEWMRLFSLVDEALNGRPF